jgi:hypothetical protein
MADVSEKIISNGFTIDIELRTATIGGVEISFGPPPLNPEDDFRSPHAVIIARTDDKDLRDDQKIVALAIKEFIAALRKPPRSGPPMK